MRWWAWSMAHFRMSRSSRWGMLTGTKHLIARLRNGSEAGLAHPGKFAGYAETEGRLSSILLKNNGLHIEIRIDRDHPVGNAHPAGVKDVLLEAAITTIQDCEDSVAAVDAADKTRVYGNWNGMMKGTLETTFEKNGQQVTRRLNPDKTFVSPGGERFTLPGRSLLLIRNVGIHMYTDCVTTGRGRGNPGRVPRRHGHHTGCNPRSQGGWGTHQQQNGQYLHRQTQAPRTGGSGGYGGAVRQSGASPGTGTEYPQDRHYGRRAPHHGEPEGSHRDGKRARGFYQYGLPGSDRRRDSHQHGSGPHAAQDGDQKPALAFGL